MDKVILKLFAWQVFIILVSNYTIQIPVQFNFFGLGVNSVLGTFLYPIIFITTDLTVRICGPWTARKVVFYAMFPALVLSYLVGTVFMQGQYQGVEALNTFNSLGFRIALASFTAYIVGQLADILVFQRLREMKQWWPAPAASSVAGNTLDTSIFTFVAFYQCSDSYLAGHWVELGVVDICVKLIASLVFFVPLYGIVLNTFLKNI